MNRPENPIPKLLKHFTQLIFRDLGKALKPGTVTSIQNIGFNHEGQPVSQDVVQYIGSDGEPREIRYTALSLKPKNQSRK